MLVPVTRVIDLGKIPFGKEKQFNYVLNNEGEKPITIKTLTVSCGSCTVAKTSKPTVAPGDSTFITVVFTPGSTGAQKKHITVEFDNKEFLTLEFRAIV